MQILGLLALSEVLKDEGATSARFWLLHSTLSKVGPVVLDEEWWEDSALHILHQGAEPQAVIEIMQYCDTHRVRAALCEFLRDLGRGTHCDANDFENVKLLLERTDGINFLYKDRSGKCPPFLLC
jgi:hypothetical protein